MSELFALLALFGFLFFSTFISFCLSLLAVVAISNNKDKIAQIATENLGNIGQEALKLSAKVQEIVLNSSGNRNPP